MKLAAVTLLLVLPVMLAVLGGFVCLFILLVKALRKYLASKEVRQEKAVSKWESGASEPSMSNLIALAKLYGVTAEEILGQTEG